MTQSVDTLRDYGTVPLHHRPIDVPFVPFPKMARLNRPFVITEKLDGTNAQVVIDADGNVRAGSRKRWISPGWSTDNYGFATWVHEHSDELRVGLGEGQHFGEWWGHGIGRGYGMDTKVFSLFNTARWSDPLVRPACCDVVPTLANGANLEDLSWMVAFSLNRLAAKGSAATPHFYGKPEGLVVYHQAANLCFKVTCENDVMSKGEAENIAKRAA